MKRLVREPLPRACDGCGKTRLVVLYALGNKSWRACSDCAHWFNEQRTRLFMEQLDVIEAT